MAKILHEDVGEKIGGARKDFHSNPMNVSDLELMTPEEKILIVKKDNIWPPMDLRKMRDAGWSAKNAHFAREMRNAIAKVPNGEDADSVREYVGTVSLMAKIVNAHPTDDPVPYFNESGVVLSDDGTNSPTMVTLAEHWKKFVVEKGWLEERFEWHSYDRDGVKKEPILSTMLHYTREAYNVLKSTSRGRRANISKAMDIVALTVRSGVLQAKIEWTDLVATEDVVEKVRKSAEGTFRLPDRPALSDIRIERSWRDGKNMTGEDLIEVFGFRGVEHGNWMTQDERQQAINLSYDSFMAISEAFGIPPKGISIDGTLSIGFGSRGHGRANAHYEPGRKVINLTKPRGAGSLAHEWSHALDHYLGSVISQGGPMSFASVRQNGRAIIKKMDFFFDDFIKSAFHNRSLGGAEALKDHYLSRYRSESERLLERLPLVLGGVVDEETIRTLVMKGTDATGKVFASLVSYEMPERVKREYDPSDLRQEIRKPLNDFRSELGKVKLTGMKSREVGLIMENLSSLSDSILYPGYYRSDRRVWDYVVPSILKEAYRIEGKKPPSNLKTDSGPSKAGYWSSAEELFARSMESVIFDVINEKGMGNEYLVHNVHETAFAGPEFKGNPYPTGDERRYIRKEMTELLNKFGLYMENLHNASVEKTADGQPYEIDYDYAKGAKTWSINGQLHREGDLPAFEGKDGSKGWFLNGKRHREGDLPAVEYDDGSKEWWVNGKKHRDGDLPASINCLGDKVWWKNGERHRDGDLPAVEYPDGQKEWWNGGKRHREGGLPAIVRQDGSEEFWIEGKKQFLSIEKKRDVSFSIGT